MQLNTCSGFGYSPFGVQADEISYRSELSTVQQGMRDIFFSIDRRKNDVIRQFDKVKQQILERLSTYSPAVSEYIEEQVVAVPLSAEAIIDTSKQVTGLSVKDLAGIFQVTRQTLYNFRSSEDKITERNWERLQAVSREIESISTILTSSPGSLMKRAPVDGQTLYQLLCADVLDTVRIEQLAKHVVKQLKVPTGSEIHHSTTIEQLTRHA